MFVKTTARKTKSGTVRYLHLAHSEWDPVAGRSVPKILYGFGREDQLDRAAIKRLVTSLTRLLDPADALAATAGGELTFCESRPFGGTFTLDALWRRLGIDTVLKSLDTGPGSKTVLPSEIHCKMDFRLVPEQDPSELLGRLKAFLREHGYGDVKVVESTMEPAARTDYRDPWAKAAIKAGEEVYGKKSIVELSSPGTGPLYVFSRRYGAPAIEIGISPHDAALHAPNENIRLDLLEKGMLWIGSTIEEYLKAKAAR